MEHCRCLHQIRRPSTPVIGGRALSGGFDCKIMLAYPHEKLIEFRKELHSNGVTTNITSTLCPTGRLDDAGWDACPYLKQPTR